MLSSGRRDEWRLRVGDWRIRFRYVPGTQTLQVLRVRPRDEAYRSVKAARRDYGVMIHVRGRHVEVDVEATAALRREMAGKNA